MWNNFTFAMRVGLAGKTQEISSIVIHNRCERVVQVQSAGTHRDRQTATLGYL